MVPVISKYADIGFNICTCDKLWSEVFVIKSNPACEHLTCLTSQLGIESRHSAVAHLPITLSSGKSTFNREGSVLLISSDTVG
jgi:hypothetical protein